MKTTTSTEEVSSHPVEKGRCEPKKHRNSPVPENNRNGLDKKFLQIYGAGRKSRKRPTLVVGKKPYGKCQIISVSGPYGADFGVGYFAGSLVNTFVPGVAPAAQVYFQPFTDDYYGISHTVPISIGDINNDHYSTPIER
jgi:hypothetical protein